MSKIIDPRIEKQRMANANQLSQAWANVCMAVVFKRQQNAALVQAEYEDVATGKKHSLCLFVCDVDVPKEEFAEGAIKAFSDAFTAARVEDERHAKVQAEDKAEKDKAVDEWQDAHRRADRRKRGEVEPPPAPGEKGRPILKGPGMVPIPCNACGMVSCKCSRMDGYPDPRD